MGGQAFEGPRLNGFWMYPEDLVIVGIDVPKENPDGTIHHLYDERINLPLSEEFILNVMALGVKENILVEKIDDKAHVFAGIQRTRAAREGNIRLAAQGEARMRVPVTVQKGDESLIMSIACSTNEFRTNDTPLVKAAKAQRLRDRGKTDEEIALSFGVSTKAIQNWGKLLELDPTVKKAIEKGDISASAGAQLHDLPKAEQKEQAKVLVEKKVATGKTATITETKASKNKSQGKAPGVAPSKRVLRFIVERKEEHALSPDFIAGVAFAIGLIDAKAVSGLAGALKAAASAPAKRKGSDSAA